MKYIIGVESELKLGSRVVVPWEKGVVFRCPCDFRQVYVISPPHKITFGNGGELTLESSCGSHEDKSNDRPKNWCHFYIKNGVPEMCSDAKCVKG